MHCTIGCRWAMLALKASSTCVRTQICRMASNRKWPIYSDQIVQSIQFEYCIAALFSLTPKLAYVTITQIYCIFSVGSFLFSVLDCALMMAVLQFSRGQLSLADLVRSSDSHGRSGARSGGDLSVRPAPPGRPAPAPLTIDLTAGQIDLPSLTARNPHQSSRQRMQPQVSGTQQHPPLVLSTCHAL